MQQLNERPKNKTFPYEWSLVDSSSPSKAKEAARCLPEPLGHTNILPSHLRSLMAQCVLDQLEWSTTYACGSRVPASKGMAGDLCRIESGRPRVLLHDARDNPGVKAAVLHLPILNRPQHRPDCDSRSLKPELNHTNGAYFRMAP